MNDYNFEKVDFDINFGNVTEKDLEMMKKQEAQEMAKMKEKGKK